MLKQQDSNSSDNVIEHSSVESSANHFGVRLRKVGANGSDEKLNTAGRRSLPPSIGVPSNCETRAAHRKSAVSKHVASSDSKSNSLPSAVLSRQEKAEKQAIERRKKTSNGNSPSSASNSWEKKTIVPKPAVAPKPVFPKGALSRSKSNAAVNGLMKKSTPKSSPLVESKGLITSANSTRSINRGSKTIRNGNKKDLSAATATDAADNQSSSLITSFYNRYEQYRPHLQSLYSQVKAVLAERGGSMIQNSVYMRKTWQNLS